MLYFFDSSAFAKRFIEESGSDEIEEICRESESIAKSKSLSEKYNLRTLNSIHIASAVILKPDFFISADQKKY